MPRETIRAEVENVQKLDYVTTVVAREHFGTRILRTRYRLAAVGESWKIIGIDRECFFCRSTGKIAGSVCQHCNGEGWHDSTNKNL